MVASILMLAGQHDEADAFLARGGIQAASSGGTATLTPWTITNNTGSTQNNIPVEVWVPFSEATGTHAFVSTDAIQILDSDGVTVIPCQEDNRSSDIGGPSLRGVKVTAILPTITGSQKRQLTAQKVATTSPTTGTDISVADLLAVTYDCTISMPYKDGNTYTASAATALAASPWTNKTTAANNGTWRTGGGIVTEYVCFCPLKNGGTAITNNLGVWFTISAYKSGRGAVSGPNPIIAVKTQYWIEGSYLQQGVGTQENHWFDLTATSGSQTQAWVGSSPAKTLTLSATSGFITCTTPTATFTADSVGNVIMDTSGNPAVIVTFNSTTSVTAYAGQSAMSGTSLTSGNWRIFGMNMKFSTKIPMQEIWFGGSPAITAKPDIDSSLGVAWSGTAGGPFTYWRDCGMVLPYTTPYSSVTNDMTKLNQCGANPTGTASGGYWLGDTFGQLEATGGFDHIAPIPGFFVGGMIKHDANGKARIMGNALKWGLMDCYYRDQGTGKSYLLNAGTDWVTDHVWGTPLPQCNGAYSGGPNSLTLVAMQDAHHPGIPLVPWLYTGDFYWVDMQQQVVFWTWCANNPGYWGSGLSRLHCCSSELRGNGWNFRDLMQAILMIPDRNPGVLGYTRSHLSTLYTNQFTKTGSGTPNVVPFPGINLGLINNTGVGKTYATAGFRAMGQAVGPGSIEAQWQLGYMALAFFLGQGQGMLDSNCAAFMTWFMEGLTGAATNANVKPNWMASAYWATCAVNGEGAGVSAWLDVHRWTCCDITEFGNNLRLIPGAGITLSGLTGSGITVTMPAGYFDTGGNNFYGNGNGATGGGGFIQDLNAASLQKLPMAPSSYFPFPYTNKQELTTDVSTGSQNQALPTNNGSVRVYNTTAGNVWVKLTVGPGTATNADTLVAPGADVAINVGANTYINYIAASNFQTIYVFGSIGANYAAADTISVTMPGDNASFSITTRAVLAVSAVGPNGDINKVTISNPGLYITVGLTVSPYTDNIMTQTATSGSGTGFSYWVWAYDSSGHSPIRQGRGLITNVTGNVLTLDTTANCNRGSNGRIEYCYPFAQTGLVTNKIRAPGPAVGDSDGTSGLSQAVPVPHSGQYEYWDIALQCAVMADRYGYANGAAAKTYLVANYTGPSEVKWRVS